MDDIFWKVLNLLKNYKKLQFKGEPYQFSG